MRPVMSVGDVRAFEAMLAKQGIGEDELMRRAGEVVALQAALHVERGTVLVLCGMGNNGGDGWVAADCLARNGFEVGVVCAATPSLIKGSLPRRMAQRTAEVGIPIHVNPGPAELAALLAEADVVVDAVFGTGFSGVMPSPYDAWVTAIEKGFEGTVLSVDVPSGIDATTGMAGGAHFDADVTVTMFALKPGLVTGQGRLASGDIVVAPLVSAEEGLSELPSSASAFVLQDGDCLDVLPTADACADKYSRGRVLVVAGSSRYPGAAVLCALAAARAGAGYVTLAVPQPVVPIAQGHLLSIPVVGLPADDDGAFAAQAADKVAQLASKADVVIAGPGLTTAFGASEVVRALLAAECALVLDADGLSALVKASLGNVEKNPEALRRARPLVLTPHRRELARLVDADLAQVDSFAGSMKAAQGIAWAVGSGNFCVVAKGPQTSVTNVEGTLMPEPGPAALATAGSGDVLAGILGGLLAQRLAGRADGSIDSADLLLLMAVGDRVHALTGYLAAAQRGSGGVIATDLPDLVGIAADRLRSASQGVPEASQPTAGDITRDVVLAQASQAARAYAIEQLVRADAQLRVGEGSAEKAETSVEGPSDAGQACETGAPETCGQAARADSPELAAMADDLDEPCPTRPCAAVTFEPAAPAQPQDDDAEALDLAEPEGAPKPASKRRRSSDLDFSDIDDYGDYGEPLGGPLDPNDFAEPIEFVDPLEFTGPRATPLDITGALGLRPAEEPDPEPALGDPDFVEAPEFLDDLAPMDASEPFEDAPAVAWPEAVEPAEEVVAVEPAEPDDEALEQDGGAFEPDEEPVQGPQAMVPDATDELPIQEVQVALEAVTSVIPFSDDPTEAGVRLIVPGEEAVETAEADEPGEPGDDPACAPEEPAEAAPVAPDAIDEPESAGPEPGQPQAQPGAVLSPEPEPEAVMPLDLPVLETIEMPFVQPEPAPALLDPQVAPVRPRPEPAPVIPAFLERMIASAGARAEAPAQPEEAPAAQAVEELTPEQAARRAREEFHESATLRVNEEKAIPLDKRPSVHTHGRRRQGR